MEMTQADVLVVGAGIGGIRSALDLAELGYGVYLMDSSPAIGGILAQLDYQFPNNHCGMCKMLPMVDREKASEFCMRKALFHDNIQIMPFTEVKEVSGEPGAFQVTLLQKARQVDVNRCMGCGKCVEVCPVVVPDEFNQGLSQRKAVYRPVPQNLPNTYIIDREHCNKCGKCMIHCPTQAIDLFLIDTQKTLQVGAIVLAGGTGFFDPAPLRDLYGCGTHPSVMTSLQFERLMSGVGPTGGRLLRPSDGKPIRSIAWIQCVGSRNLHLQRDYCSSICCMFALKEAVLAKEASSGQVDTAIFYMDMRTYGKDFYRYQRWAEEEKGVRLIRSRVHTAVPLEDGTLSIRYVDEEGSIQEEAFDIVVLSTGQTSQSGLRELMEKLGVSPNAFGFALPLGFSLVRTENPGVFVCGSVTGLKDISETLVQAGAAAAETATFLASKGMVGTKEVPAQEEKDLARAAPRVGIVLCRCMGSTEGNLDWVHLVDRLKGDRWVETVLEVDQLCSDEVLDEVLRRLQPTQTNRLLMGACLPYVYKRKLRHLGIRLGLNPVLVEVVDLRSLGFSGNGSQARATKEAELLLHSVLERLKRRDPLSVVPVPVTQRALVVGGGIAGMTAALTISRMGFPVTLVEKDKSLGGRLRHIYHTLDGPDPHRLLADIVKQVEDNPSIEVLTETQIVESHGRVGAFQTVLRDRQGNKSNVEHGVTILATGAQAARPADYCYGQSDRVFTQEEFEEALAQFRLPKERLKTVVMIQCVGSRDENRPYCSRVCCSSALKNAFKTLQWNKDARIYILYRDLMTYGFLEEHYTRARAAGIRFIPYRVHRKPEVSIEEGLPVVRFHDPILQREAKIRAEALVLSTGIVPPEDTQGLAAALGLVTNQDGFLLEADAKWRPVDFLKEGVFLCGTAHSPRSIAESMAQAQAAAQRALAILRRQEILSARMIADVKRSICTLCETCVALCPYQARKLDVEEGVIVVDPAACQGCGACAVACPSGAAFVRGLEDKATMAVIDATLEDAFAHL
ncbi:MAG: FAD-dependent oxidoreductase [bacterium]